MYRGPATLIMKSLDKCQHSLAACVLTATRQEVDLLIWLASYPRSGNTLLRMVLARDFGYHTCSLYREHEEDDRIELANLFAISAASLVRQAIDADPEVHFLKTHEVASEDDEYPSIYVVRDGRDAVVSFAHYLIDFVIGKDQSQPEQQYRHVLHDVVTCSDMYGGWSRNVETWMQRPRSRRHPVEELVSQPTQAVAAALRNVNLTPAAQGENGAVNFQELHRTAPRFFRAGKKGGWQTEMDEDLESAFWHAHGATMEVLGYTRTVGPVCTERLAAGARKL